MESMDLVSKKQTLGGQERSLKSKIWVEIWSLKGVSYANI